ncbi:hypothetical protein V6N12_025636 [Hibiscus sabdariffa]|uniref:Uncharacterized protein n=1 Tax=Hibiscus sabdariffa TaxID=183260 RepID=A0ABR2CJ20_9ROSI
MLYKYGMVVGTSSIESKSQFHKPAVVATSQTSRSSFTSACGLRKMTGRPTFQFHFLNAQEDELPLMGGKRHGGRYLCAWGNDAASEVLTKARLLLVENYFQTPSLASVQPRP